MTAKSRKALFMLVTTGLLLEPVGRLLGSGYFYEEAIFVRRTEPDPPLEKYVNGGLGIVQPTYRRAYLYIAYRNLAGSGFNEQEEKGLEAIWAPGRRQGQMMFLPSSNGQPEIARPWIDARNRVPGLPMASEIRPYREGFVEGTNYLGYLNCPGDAFRTAAATLQKRIDQFGSSNALIKGWVQAQDEVFSNCGGQETLPRVGGWMPPEQRKSQPAATPAPDGNIPPPASSETPALLRADRAYQIAAANFYAGNFEVAQRLFEEISRDSSSPWHELAPYLAARTLVREATLEAGPSQVNRAALGRAETQLNAILGDASLRPIHSDAQRLLNLVRLTLYPEQRLHELAQALMKASSGKTLTQDVIDFSRLLDILPVGKSAGANGDDLTDWIWTLQSNTEASRRRAFENWEQARTLPWLVAAISKARADDPGITSLLEAAEKTAPGSPAFLCVNYHVVRLLRESGTIVRGRAKLDALLGRQDWKTQRSAFNLFLAQRMALARNLEEFLKFAPRALCGVTAAGLEQEYKRDADADPTLESFAYERLLFDSDSTRILNEGMPLELLKDAATRSVLPPRPRREVALATWVRAFLLGNETVAMELVPVVEKLAPEISSNLEVYRAAKTPEARETAAMLTLLRFPGLRPYVLSGRGRLTPLGGLSDLRDNWWCPFPPKTNGDSKSSEEPPFAPFLDAAEQAETGREFVRLTTVETGPNFLGRGILTWARKHPNDPRVPSALYTVVRLPHLGCADKQTGDYSHAAFQLLHRRYPQSQEAKTTKYWYR